ncbi:MAG: FlgD immunoglobulin-like domain containing protein [Candidatus Latescibacteria bacterium]|nr:FlgD immunoglobulin-like domain containing protein [Candidatus Latescibacterota bacterium]
MKPPPRIVLVLVPLTLVLAAAAAPLLANDELLPRTPAAAPAPPAPDDGRAIAWLTCPDWRMQVDDYGYSDYLESYRPRWPVAWPWSWSWGSDFWLSGEWAAAISYDQIPSPAIAQGPNAGLPQTMWLEPNFVAPAWNTNSGFWVLGPVQSWNRGHLPPPYLDTSASTITNGQVVININSIIVDNPAGMSLGRCSSWPYPWNSYVESDRYILHVTYTIRNVSGQVLTNVEFAQFLHGHPGDHNENAMMGDWEVYDPFRKWRPMDAYDNFHYDITQWGSQYLNTWPWYQPYWGNWSTHFIGFAASVPPTSQRSPSPWGLGVYNGHNPGKPPRPGVHWDVEEHNLNPVGPPCTLYPPGYPVFGQQVAGAENWYLDPAFEPNEVLVHEVVLGMAIRAHHGWHWANDWWYWHNYDWPTPIPQFSYVLHPNGWPYYYYRVAYPYWWNCYYYPRPAAPIWFGFAWPIGAKEEGAKVARVVAKSRDSAGLEVRQEFLPDPDVTADLALNWPWPDYDWYGFSVPDYALADSTFEVEVLIEGVFTGDVTRWAHAMIGDPEYGWSPDHYDSTIVAIHGPTGTPPATPIAAPVLAPIRPNPFNASIAIDFVLPSASPVRLEIFDLTGRLVATVLDEPRTAGPQSASWNGRDARGAEIGSGVYVARLTACGGTVSQQMTMVK